MAAGGGAVGGEEELGGGGNIGGHHGWSGLSVCGGIAWSMLLGKWGLRIKIVVLECEAGISILSLYFFPPLWLFLYAFLFFYL